MHRDFFETPIEYLKGVGPQRAELLRKELGIVTYWDLLNHFPFRYVDRSKFYHIREISSFFLRGVAGETAELPYIQLRGELKSLVTRGDKRRKVLVGKFRDETGAIELVWFQGLKWLTPSLKLNTEYIIFGKPTEYKGHINIAHPEMELAAEADKQLAATNQAAVYNTTEKLTRFGLDSRGILRIQKTLQQQLHQIPESLSIELIDAFKLLNRHESYINVHFPENNDKLQKAIFRLKFEEFFFLQLKLLISKVIRSEKISGKKFEIIGDNFNIFYKEKLTFPLTEAQKRVIREIRADCGSGKQMNRLLQGDVGSGKTIVALLSMLMAIDNGCQACLMAPTEILAQQHAESISVLLEGSNINMALLTGSTKTKQRQHLLTELVNGNIQILIGTHALIEQGVQFKNLGLVIIDEQHRFGVEQRARLWTKESGGSSKQPTTTATSSMPHVLVMTATPIPRTLAMTLYGDLDVSVIDEMPPGRKPVKTFHRTDAHRLAVWGFLKKQIEEGRQVYIVYPLIEESAKIDLKNLEEGFEAVCRDFPMPKYQVSILHGRMKSSVKEYEMQRFVRGETNIMVATTVIEVGVNVQNASVMVIENAERFGLSQLHQLRGRVGRGAAQSYCILMTNDKLGNDARLRMKTMCDTNDGFKIAEVDLQLRGAGNIEGTQQSGIVDLKIGNLAKDGTILSTARQAAIKILAEDSHLRMEKNLSIRKKLATMMKGEFLWGRVG